MKPPNVPPQSQMNLDILSKATDIVCDRCTNATFQEVVLFKHVSAIISPTGKAGNVPIPTFSCVACGWVNNAFLPFPANTAAPRPETPSTLVHTTPEAPVPEKPRLQLVTE